MTVVFSNPPLSRSTAHLLTLIFTVSYVGSLYVSKHARLVFQSRSVTTPTHTGKPRTKQSEERWRDDPDVIKARLAVVSVSTLASLGAVFVTVWNCATELDKHVNSAMIFQTTLIRLGLTLDGQSIFSHLVTPLLYLGPLFVCYLAESLPFQRMWSFSEDVVPLFYSWQGARNYIIAPVTEELVWRGCILSVYHLSGASVKTMIFLTPLSFGTAHIHHAWDTYNRYGRTVAAFQRALIMTLFQLTYTTLFGAYCAYLFLRTGSILPPLTAHIWCNIFGIPQPSWELQQFPLHKKKIIAAYVIGIVAFALSLGPWTRTQDNLYWPSGRRYMDVY